MTTKVYRESRENSKRKIFATSLFPIRHQVVESTEAVLVRNLLLSFLRQPPGVEQDTAKRLPVLDRALLDHLDDLRHLYEAKLDFLVVFGMRIPCHQAFSEKYHHRLA